MHRSASESESSSDDELNQGWPVIKKSGHGSDLQHIMREMKHSTDKVDTRLHNLVKIMRLKNWKEKNTPSGEVTKFRSRSSSIFGLQGLQQSLRQNNHS